MHIDTTRAPRHDQHPDTFLCANCATWTRWVGAPRAEGLDRQALARQTTLRTYRCPTPGCGKAHQVAVGALGDDPRNTIECACEFEAAAVEESFMVRTWQNGVLQQEPRTRLRVTMARRTYSVATLLATGALLQSRPYGVEQERAMA
jgi:hypothetical protein